MKKKAKTSKHKAANDNKAKRLNIMRVPVNDIVIGDGFREVDPQAVADLAQSLQKLGLMHPPTVYLVKKTIWSKTKTTIHLVAGRHRVEAARGLGWKFIDVLVVEQGKSKNRLRQITENLHRKDLSQREDTALTKEWVEMCAEEGGKVSHPQPHDKGISRAAKALKKSPKAVRLTLKKSAITDEAWKELEKAGLSEKQSVALKVAEAPPEKQVAKVQEIVEQRKQDKQKKKASKKLKAAQPKKSKVAASKTDVSDDDWSDTSLEKLKAAWEDSPALRKEWANASADDRQHFIDEVLLADDNANDNDDEWDAAA